MKKHVFTLVLVLIMVFGLLPVTALALTDSEPNDTLATAQKFTMGDTISGVISENEDADWYKFTLNASGRISFKFTSYMEYYSVWLYDTEGNEIWDVLGKEANSATGMRVDTYNIDLTEGVYYIRISATSAPGLTGNFSYSSGNYTLDTAYTNANANETEPNDTIQDAQPIPFNKAINGQCALNNRDDYFKIDLPADGRLTLTFTSYMEYYSMWLYDTEGNEIWDVLGKEANSTTGMRVDTYNIDLTEGIYYIRISAASAPGLTGHFSYSSGNYTLDTAYTNANADETEPNDTIQDAQPIPFNKAINGQCALNNRDDYFKIDLSADGRLTLTFTSYMEYYSMWLYDTEGNEIWDVLGKEANSATCMRVDTYDIDLTKGIYYIRISAASAPGLTGKFSYSSGNYTIKLNTENPFDDVPSGSWFEDPVLWALENGITSGTSDTTFSPGNQCLRAHVVTFLWNAEETPEPAATSSTFTDVPAGAWYEKPVLWAVENGITSGVSPNKFGAGDVCSRYQVVYFLWKAAGAPEPKTIVNPFTDVNPGHFFYKAVLWAVENGITSGTSDTTFSPTQPCNRAQVVTFLYAAYT